MKLPAKPVEPRLPRQLEPWYSDSSLDLTVEGCEINQADFNNLERLEIESSKLQSVALSAKLQTLSLRDTELHRIEAAGLQTYKTFWLRTFISNSRCTGADFGAGTFEDCSFTTMKFDEAGFRYATFKRVRFESCNFQRTDFSHCSFKDVSFADCDFTETNFDQASCQSVDFRGENLSLVKGVLGLRGAVISQEQLIQIAPLLAIELNFSITDDI